MVSKEMKVAIVVGAILLLGVAATDVAVKWAPSTGATGVGSSAAMTADRAPQAVSFSDGTTVELLGIQSEPFDRAWWGIDGNEIPPPPHPDQPRIHMSGGEGTRTVRLILRQTGATPGGQRVNVQVEPGIRTGNSGYETGGEQMLEAMAIVADSATTADVRVGVAGGLWTTDVSYDVTMGQYSPAGVAEFRVGNIAEEAGESSVGIFSTPDSTFAKDHSIVVIVKGRALQPVHGKEHGPGTIWYFQCARKDISAVVSRSREYETKVISGVRLVPSASPATTAP